MESDTKLSAIYNPINHLLTSVVTGVQNDALGGYQHIPRASDKAGRVKTPVSAEYSSGCGFEISTAVAPWSIL